MQAPFRSLFPYFSEQPLSGQSSVYLDSGATSQKLQSVVQAVDDYYSKTTANVHRSQHQLGAGVTAQFEQVRKDIQCFIGAKQPKEVVFTKGATEGLNLIAHGLQDSNLLQQHQTNIVIACSEHHANIVPWQRLAEVCGLQIRVIPVNANGQLDLTTGLSLITPETALVAVAHVSNALGNINPIEAIIEKARVCNALTVIDGTQAVAHMPVNVAQLGCDFYVFSGHKMYGPTGIGVLYGKYALLDALPPYQVGGEMVTAVSFTEGTKYQEPPMKFEAGTPNIAGVLGLGQAVKFLDRNMSAICDYEHTLTEVLVDSLQRLPQIKLWGDLHNKICAQSITVNGLSPYDLAIALDAKGFALRAGRHCAMPLMEALDIPGTLRVSLGCYNTRKDVLEFVEALRSVIDTYQDEALDSEQSQDQLEAPHSRLSKSSRTDTHNTTNRKTFPLAKKIKQAKSWDEKYRQIMLAGKGLTRLTEADKTEGNKASGCESEVWLSCNWSNNHLKLRGDSTSKIIRGLLAVIFEALENCSPEQLAKFDLTEYLQELQLAKQLSESRGNGLAGVVAKIKQIAE